MKEVSNKRREKELSELQELIRENKEVVLKYPDDYALKLNLESLMKREELLKSSGSSKLIPIFKVWDMVNKAWITDFMINPYGEVCDIYSIPLKGIFECIRFTGFRDKNNKAIYGGDVLIFSKWKYIVRVIWSDYIGGWYMVHHGGNNDSTGCNFLNEFNSLKENDGGYEIIDNIYENIIGSKKR